MKKEEKNISLFIFKANTSYAIDKLLEETVFNDAFLKRILPFNDKIYYICCMNKEKDALKSLKVDINDALYNVNGIDAIMYTDLKNKEAKELYNIFFVNDTLDYNTTNNALLKVYDKSNAYLYDDYEALLNNYVVYDVTGKDKKDIYNIINLLKITSNMATFCITDYFKYLAIKIPKTEDFYNENDLKFEGINYRYIKNIDINNLDLYYALFSFDLDDEEANKIIDKEFNNKPNFNNVIDKLYLDDIDIEPTLFPFDLNEDLYKEFIEKVFVDTSYVQTKNRKLN